MLHTLLKLFRPIYLYSGSYRATLWLRNPGPSRRLHNQLCDVFMIFDHDMTRHVHCILPIDRFSFIPSGPPGILDFPSLAAILFFTYSELCYITLIYVITLFIFVTIYFTYSTQTFQIHLYSQWLLQHSIKLLYSDHFASRNR